MFTQILLAIVPSVGIGFLFYKVIKTIVESDRKERLAYAQWQAAEDARASRVTSVDTDPDK